MYNSAESWGYKKFPANANLLLVWPILRAIPPFYSGSFLSWPAWKTEFEHNEFWSSKLNKTIFFNCSPWEFYFRFFAILCPQCKAVLTEAHTIKTRRGHPTELSWLKWARAPNKIKIRSSGPILFELWMILSYGWFSLNMDLRAIATY